MEDQPRPEAPPARAALDTDWFFELTRDLACIVDDEGRYHRVNPAWKTVLGFERAELIGQSMYDLIHPDDLRATAGTVDQVRSGEAIQHFENRYRCKDGLYRWISWSAVPISADGFRYGIGRDVTDQRANARALQESEARAHQLAGDLQAVLDALPAQLALLDGEGRILSVNTAWRAFAPSRDLIGRRYVDVCGHAGLSEHEARTAAAGLQPVLDGSTPDFSLEYSCVAGGQTRWFLLRAARLSGHPGAVVLHIDVTERNMLQRRLAIADRMASVGTLAAGVAHEINNPLSFLMANVSFARESVEAQREQSGPSPWLEDALETLGRAWEGSERIRNIVRNMGKLSRSDEDAREVFDIRRSLDSAISIATHEIRHRAQLVRDYRDVSHVDANDARICQVFVNLLVNAAQAIPEGAAERNEIRVSTRMEGADRVVAEIRDTGPGIPPEILPRIFDPFFTTKPVGVGTGLGLSICHGIVQQLGGAIQVQSEVGKGTLVRVTLPASRLTPFPIPPPPPMRAAPRRGRFFLVDDEPEIASIFHRAFDEQHEVKAFSSARELLQDLDVSDDVDAIFCDLMMPEMSGMELFEEIKRSRPALAPRVVFISGGAFTPNARAFLDKVTNRYLAKPFDLDALRRLLPTLLE